jgi:UDP-N-acetylglucosamine--N-acetylmuramyl-(pentapeptide) pyrophosphoryl-undecaprenol N-acetylglucosamine transferase
LLLGRAGGMTVSEVLAVGMPSVLVPSPNVAQNHQLHNARAAEASLGSVLMLESELTLGRLAGVLNSILTSPDTMAQMAARAKSAGRPLATNQIVDHLDRLAQSH